MTIPKIAINTRATQYTKLIGLGTAVAEGLQTSPHFGSPPVSVATLNAAISQVADMLGAWGPKGNRGSHADLMLLRGQSRILWQYLKAEAKYVEATAILLEPSSYDDMAVIMLSSGFALKRTPHKQGALGVVQNLQFMYSPALNRNQVKVVWDRPLEVTCAVNVKSYIYYRSETANFAGAVQIGAASKCMFVDSNVTGSTVTYSYFVAAVGAGGIRGAVSNPITISLLPA